jgi:hypothetical protein
MELEGPRLAPSGWTERIYAAIPIAPVWVGALFAGILILLFLGIEFVLGRHELFGTAEEPELLAEARAAITHCLLLAYAPTAYLYVVRGSRGALLRLQPALDYSGSEFAELSQTVGRYPWWTLALAGLTGVALATWMAFETTPEGPFAWSEWNPELLWHRVLNPLIGWWMGCFIYAALAESNRLSRLARRLKDIDLLDLRSLMPFTRQALTNALLVVGAVSVTSLFLLEQGFGLVIARLWLGTAAIATASFVLPVRGVHRRIQADKRAELDCVQAAIRGDRAGLSETRIAGQAEALSLADLLAYEARVSGVREWPFDASTFVRLSLYLMIPLASWAGGALVERFIDSLLD